MERFYSDPKLRCIVIPENLKIVEVVPTKMPRGKGLAFIKLVDRLSKDGGRPMSSTVLSVELGGSSPFEHLELISASVLLPVVSNPGNQLGWGEMTARDVSGSFHALLSSTSILCGHAKGETRLPIPPIEELSLIHI